MVTDSGLGMSASASLISVSGNIGGKIKEKGYEISATIGGSVGLNTGFEFQLDYSRGIVLDVAFIFGARIEINWRKYEN